MRIGDKVRLKKSYAKWHLDHPEVYDSNWLRYDGLYEIETIIHLICCLGEPVYGKVVDYQHTMNTYHVVFTVGKLKMSYWVERKHVNKVVNV